jgi:hypothetical protein
MLARLMVALALVLIFAGGAAAQATPLTGTYNMEWSILHVPVSSDLPDLQDGTSQIVLEAASGGLCPPTSAFMVQNAPAFGGATTTWCIKSDGSFDVSASGNGAGTWNQYITDIAIIEADNRRGNDHIQAVARRATTPPPAGTLKVSITAPHNGDTVAGTVWVVMWVDGASGTSNVFTLSVDGTAVGTSNAGSSHGPVTIPWSSTSALNGTHTITGSVKDATGNTGSTSISVILRN